MILKMCKYFLFVLSFYYASAQVDDIFIDSLIKNKDVRFFQKENIYTSLKSLF